MLVGEERGKEGINIHRNAIVDELQLFQPGYVVHIKGVSNVPCETNSAVKWGHASKRSYRLYQLFHVDLDR